MLRKTYEESETRGWQITFSDMLILMLTFFVFIISISAFEIVEYKKFWKTTDKDAPEIKAKSKSFKFDLISGLKLPVLNAEADKLLTEIESTFDKSDFDGVSVFYDENKISLMVSEQLSFEGAKDQLKADIKPLLLKLVDPINKSKFDINIEGHSDTLVSPRIDNMKLSLNRALNVARFLIASGVDKKKVSVSGYGPYRPVASNNTPEGRQANRRVEVNVMIRND
jgi:chemotaxis protein MotB